MPEIDFDDLNYESFKKLAQSPNINQHERVGFPAWYRDNKVDDIFQDILTKCTNFGRKKIRILDIGPGWSDLTKKILDHCQSNGDEIVLIDSREMLDLIPPYLNLTKIPGNFPDEVCDLSQLGEFDVILVYSVIQYPFAESNIFKFLDSAAHLLKKEGQLLVGDIPNISMKKRFLDSESAKEYHNTHHAPHGKDFPTPQFNIMEKGQIDDGVMIGLLLRMRIAGFQAFLVPQGANLPMSNRREDLLILRP